MSGLVFIASFRSKLRSDVNAVQTLRIREIKGSPELAYYGNVEVKTLVFGEDTISSLIVQPSSCL